MQTFHLVRRPVGGWHRLVATALCLISLGCAEAWARPSPDTALTTLVKKRLGRVRIVAIKHFYGDFTGDGRDDALVFAYFDPRSGGNAVDLDVMLYKGEPGGFSFLRKVQDVFGENPRAAKFSRGRVSVTLTTLGPDDPRCCPTVAKEYTITAP